MAKGGMKGGKGGQRIPSGVGKGGTGGGPEGVSSSRGSTVKPCCEGGPKGSGCGR